VQSRVGTEPPSRPLPHENSVPSPLYHTITTTQYWYGVVTTAQCDKRRHCVQSNAGATNILPYHWRCFSIASAPRAGDLDPCQRGSMDHPIVLHPFSLPTPRLFNISSSLLSPRLEEYGVWRRALSTTLRPGSPTHVTSCLPPRKQSW
jgi:hypothetical protein